MDAACASQLPKDAVCPISQHVMEDPVVCADGHSYERRCIQEWFNRGHQTSPRTNELLPSRALIPNISLRNTIEELTQQMPTRQKGQVLWAKVQLKHNLGQRLDFMAARSDGTDPDGDDVGQEPPHCIPGRATSSSRGFLSARCTSSAGVRWETVTASDFQSKHRRSLKSSGARLNAYARYLGIDPVADPDLLWIATEALEAPLPAHWSEHHDGLDRVFYFNAVTHESRWRHPLEQIYRDAYQTISSFRHSNMSPEERVRRLDDLRQEARCSEVSCQEELSLWTEHGDEDGHQFYFNFRDQQSTWTDPRPAVRDALNLRLKVLGIAALTAKTSLLPRDASPMVASNSSSSTPPIAQSPRGSLLMSGFIHQEQQSLHSQTQQLSQSKSYWDELFSALSMSSSPSSKPPPTELPRPSDTIVSV